MGRTVAMILVSIIKAVLRPKEQTANNKEDREDGEYKLKVQNFHVVTWLLLFNLAPTYIPYFQ
jgi:hypothetical protein